MKIKTLIAGIGIAVGSLFYSQQDSFAQEKYEEIDLSLKDEGTGNLTFNNLEDWLAYVNSTEQISDDEIERTTIYPNTDRWELAGMPERTYIDISGNQVVRGLNSATSAEPLTPILEIKEFDSTDKTQIKNGIRIRSGVTLENLVFNGYFGVEIVEGNTNVKNCYFDNQVLGIRVASNITGNVLIEGNVLNGKGLYSGIIANINENATTKLRNNTLVNYDTGLLTSDVALIDLGTELENGNNSFVANKNNLTVFKTPETIPAQYNLWTSPKNAQTSRSTILTTEEDIISTINVINLSPTKQNITKANVNATDIEVVPFKTRLDYYPVTKVKNWELYK